MRHLREDEFIDVLMGESHEKSLDEHLAHCAECTQTLSTLSSGLGAVRSAEPRVPLMALPPITYKSFERRRKSFQMVWLAAAAILLMGLLGLKIQIGNNQMTVQFSFLGGENSASESRIAELEQNLAVAMNAIEAQQSMTQQQMDARFNQLYLDQDREFSDLQAYLARYNNNTRLENESNLVSVKNSLIEEVRKQGFKGALQ